MWIYDIPACNITHELFETLENLIWKKYHKKWIRTCAMFYLGSNIDYYQLRTYVFIIFVILIRKVYNTMIG